MGWARVWWDDFDDLGVDKLGRGYSYKLCPWSQEYRDRWIVEGPISVGLDSFGNQIIHDGTLVLGNSVNQDFYGAYYATYQCSVHTTTSGRMVHSQNPPGWLCDDPSCYYFTTVASGRFYSEV